MLLVQCVSESLRLAVCRLAICLIPAAALMAQNPVVRNLSCAANSGSTSAYSCSMPWAPPAYAAGSQYAFQADVANAGAATINFNSLGAKTIKKFQGGVAMDLSANDIRAGQWVFLMYDGANMQMLSQLGNGGGAGGSWGSITGTLSNQSDLQTALNGLASLSGNYVNPSWITSLSWSKVTGVPSTFAPSAHAGSHASNGSDPLSPSAIGALSAVNPDIGTSALTIEYANDTTTGTTAKYLVKLLGSNKRVVTGGVAVSGLIGICVTNCGASGNAVIAIRGRSTCTFDNATVEADYVQADGATGKCHDAGASFPTAGGQVVGQVLENGGVGDHEIRLGAEVQAVAPGGNSSAVVNVQGGTSYTLQASDNGAVIAFTNASPVTLTVPSGLGAGFNVGILQLGAGTVTPTASSTTIHQRLSLTKTGGQYAFATLVAYTADTFALSGDVQ
jgi:hypothetical protein